MFKILPGTVHTACGRLRERSWPDAFTRLSLASPVRDSFLFLSAKGNVHCIIFLIAITIVTIILEHFKMFLKLTSLHLKLQGPTMLNHLTNKSNISLHSPKATLTREVPGGRGLRGAPQGSGLGGQFLHDAGARAAVRSHSPPPRPRPVNAQGRRSRVTTGPRAPA